jgi:hypothetical protein
MMYRGRAASRSSLRRSALTWTRTGSGVEPGSALRTRAMICWMTWVDLGEGVHRLVLHFGFAWMSRNATSASAFFSLPPNQVIELGAQVRL